MGKINQQRDDNLQRTAQDSTEEMDAVNKCKRVEREPSVEGPGCVFPACQRLLGRTTGLRVLLNPWQTPKTRAHLQFVPSSRDLGLCVWGGQMVYLTS